MRLLLDTHAVLWHYSDSARLGREAAVVLSDARNDLFVSMASLWEMAIKSNIGKLRIPIPGSLNGLIDYLVGDGVSILPVGTGHVLRVESMALHHRDPFDRMLVAQALVDGLDLVSNEEVFDQYGVKRVW